MDTAILHPNVGRSANVTLDKIQERKEFIISLCLAGMTKYTILEQVNMLSDLKKWGQLGSVRSIERTIAKPCL
jgi:ubiquitin-protein ligase